MGGALSLLLAAEQPVDGVVSMDAPILLDDWRLNYARALSHVYPFIPKQGFDPQQKLNARYAVQPMHAVAELQDLLTQLRPRLPSITAPALIVHSLADTFIPLANFDAIYRELGAPQKEKLLLKESGHIVTEDVEQAVLFARISQFVRGRETRPRPFLHRVTSKWRRR